MLIGGLLSELQIDGDMQPSESYTLLQDRLAQALTYTNGFLRYGPGKQIDTGQWWLRDDAGAASPLADRVETRVIDILAQNRSITIADLEYFLQLEPDAAESDLAAKMLDDLRGEQRDA